MNRRLRDFGDVGDLAYGLAQSVGSGTASLGGQLVVVPAQMAYLHLPANELRSFVDGMFPHLATNRLADSAMGIGHRYRAGHDLFLDIPRTFGSHGQLEGWKHAGHVLLTDFPTKAGIPIPGLSQAGLGHLLEGVGIQSGWLHVSFFDAGVGILAVADGASLLRQALQGALSMDFGAACHTFGVGSAEIVLAMAPPTQSALLLAGGIQKVLAGVIATWNTFSVYVDPLDFLGAGGTSALLGFGIAYGLMSESLSDATLNAARSGAIGAMYTLSSAFGFGALAGFVVCRLGSALATRHNAAAQDRLSVDEHSYRLLIQELSAGNIEVRDMLKATEPRWIGSNSCGLTRLKESPLSEVPIHLPSRVTALDRRPSALRGASTSIQSLCTTLADDPPVLRSIYKAANQGRSLASTARA